MTISRTAIATTAFGVLALTACSGGSSDPANLSKTSDIQKWIEKAGYKCSDWQENSDTHAVCRTEGGGSFTVSIDDDPQEALEWYFEGTDWANGAVGENWISPCMVSEMSRFADFASAAGVDLVTNPAHTN